MSANENHAAPFHAGECAVQEKVGVRDKLARIGAQVIRDHMPDQHRAFFSQLPFVMIGALDADGQPWTSILTNQPGFIATPDSTTMEIKAFTLPQDPLHAALKEGAAIGLLGIEPHTRRRNRMNGIIECIHSQGFSVKVSQSFGNCPKYIQARQARIVDRTGDVEPIIHSHTTLDAAARRLIAQADTFFIATAHPKTSGTPTSSQGVDVSHRGGKPGFVRVDDEVTLTAPDFIGNSFFNTLGNLTLNPLAGLLFIDFTNGDLLYLSVKAEIIWDGDVLTEFEGAERLLRFHVTQVKRLTGALPIHWGDMELSPHLTRMGENTMKAGL